MKFITCKQYWEYMQNNSLRGLAETEGKYQIPETKEKYPEKRLKEIDKKHDKIFRNVLSRKNEVAKFLNQFLNLQERIQEEDIIAYPTDFVTKRYETRQSDIIYKLKDKPVYFLIEHQSTIDKEMALRIWEYVGEIIRKEKMRTNLLKKDVIYPIVIPIVIYTGSQKWTAKTNFAQKQYQSRLYKKYQIDLEYNLISVHDYTFEELLEKRTLLGSILLMEKCKSKRELEMYAKKIIETIEDCEAKKEQVEVIYATLLPYIDKEIANKILQKLKEREVISMSPLTKMILDLEIKGEKRGIAQGRLEVIKETVKNMLQLGETEDKIVKYIGISKEELKEIKGNLTN